VPGLDGAVPADRSHEVLGRKGLLFKEPATRLALCAVHRALGLPDGARRPPGPPDPRTAVVASSNLGNVATVRGIVRTLREGSVRDVSPLDAPNASSNVIASTVAIWFGFGGPNLMVCSGASSGLDAVALALLLLRSGRADRVVVVGAEPDDEVARELYGPALRAAAAAVVAEPAGGPIGLWMGGAAEQAIDPAPEVAGTYGALGVLQVAAGADLLCRSPETDAVVVACDRRTATLCRQPAEVRTR
jgi:3-oxoacyl-[acyl-carrier-protein] synthase II